LYAFFFFTGFLRMPPAPACRTNGAATDGTRNFGIVETTVGLAGADRLSLANEARHLVVEAMAWKVCCGRCAVRTPSKQRRDLLFRRPSCFGPLSIGKKVGSRSDGALKLRPQNDQVGSQIVQGSRFIRVVLVTASLNS